MRRFGVVIFVILTFFSYLSFCEENALEPTDEISLQIYPCRIDDYTWTPSMNVLSVVLSPSIPVIPGSITVSAIIEIISDNVSRYLNAESSVKLILPIGGMIPLGCSGSNQYGCGGFGSCKYCNLLGDCYQPENGDYQDNSCKPTRGKYRVVVHRNINKVPFAVQLFGLETLATWEIELKVVDAVSNATLGCGVVYVFSRFKF